MTSGPNKGRANPNDCKEPFSIYYKHLFAQFFPNFMVLISADLQIDDALNSGMLENDLSKNKRFPASTSSNISSEFSNINKHEPTKFPVKSNLLWALYDFPETWT